MEIWGVIARSCSSCDSLAVNFFDHEPSEEEKMLVSESIGGMWCINSYIFKGELNGEPVEPLIEE